MAELPLNLVGEAYQILSDIEEWQHKYSDFFQKKSGIIASTDMNIYDLMIKLKLKLYQELALDIDSDAGTL